MSRMTRRLILSALAALCAGPATAETLRCRSVNGNVTCAGSGATSCQTVDGRTTCVANGIRQEFGAGAPRGLSVERAGPGARLSLRREEGRLRIERRDEHALDLDDLD